MSNTLTIEPELNSLETKLVAAIEEDSREVKLRQKRIKTNEALLIAVRNSRGLPHPESNEEGYGTKSDMLRNAIAHIPNNHFTLSDVEAEISRSHPGVHVDNKWLRTALWSAAKKQKLIKLILKGSNSQPAQYEKVIASNGIHNGTSNTNEANRRAVGISGNKGPFTVGDFEDYIREKARRINTVVSDFGVDESTVDKMLEPASRVYRAEKGWLKLRE